MSQLLAAFVAVFAAIASAQEEQQTASQQRAAAAAKNIALSPDVATGVFIGMFLLSLLIFGVKMLDGIQTSDKIGTNKPELTQ